jgi:hypothetical protein
VFGVSSGRVEGRYARAVLERYWLERLGRIRLDELGLCEQCRYAADVAGSIPRASERLLVDGRASRSWARVARVVASEGSHTSPPCLAPFTHRAGGGSDRLTYPDAHVSTKQLMHSSCIGQPAPCSAVDAAVPH